MIDLENTDSAELRKMQSEIEAKLKEQEEQERAQAIAQINELVTKHGITLSMLISEGVVSKVKEKKKAPLKYMNPQDHTQVWSGCGRMPKWAKALHDDGNLDSALIFKPE